MTIYFTADTHFGHVRTLELSKRPFTDIAHMDSIIATNWNAVVKPDDIVYHLGDFGDIRMLQYLNGQIKLLPGNYDDEEFVTKAAKYCQILYPNTIIVVGAQVFQLVHEPLEAINKGVFFLYGHIHKLQMVKRNGLNVGTDCHNFYPIDVDTVIFYKTAIEQYYDENVFIESLADRSS